MPHYMDFLVRFLTATGFTVILSTQVLAKSSISLGHYFIDAPTENYQFTSLSMSYQYASFKAKLMVPFIQREAFSNGLGNPLIKLSNNWRFNDGSKQLTLIYKQKLALANNDTTTAVSDTAVGFEYSEVFNWGIAFIEGGHWWRDSVSYTRKNSVYGTMGVMKPFKKYVLALLIDNKPTALGGEDSMASLFLRKKLTHTLSISGLYGRGLNDSSPNNMLGLQISQAL